VTDPNDPIHKAVGKALVGEARIWLRLASWGAGIGALVGAVGGGLGAWLFYASATTLL
jgi:hypothetical protein